MVKRVIFILLGCLFLLFPEPGNADEAAGRRDDVVEIADVPLVPPAELKQDLHRDARQLHNWFLHEKEALLVLAVGSAVSILVGVLLSLASHWLIRRQIDRHRRLSLRWQLFEALAGPLVLLLVVVSCFIFLMPLLEAQNQRFYPFDLKMFFASLALIVSWGVFHLIDVLDRVMHKVAQRTDNNLDDLRVDIMRKSLKIAMLILIILFIGQGIFNIDLTTLAAGAGVIGLGIAFAAKDSLSNFFGIIVIIADEPFRVGDRIMINQIDGIVEQVGLRSSRIRTASESVYVIPNSVFISSPIENISRRGVIRYVFSIGLTYDCNRAAIEKATALLHQILDDFHGPDAEEYKPRIYFGNFGDWALSIKVIIWFKTADFVVEEAYLHELNLLILEKFAEAGLPMAFPTNTTYLLGSPQQPLAIQTEPPASASRMPPD